MQWVMAITEDKPMTEPMQHTADTAMQSDNIKEWYKTHNGKAFLSNTYDGRFAYTWIAKLADGTEVRQYADEALFNHLVNDPDAPDVTVLKNMYTPMSKLDVKTVKEIKLIPLGFTRSNIPNVQPQRLVVDLEADEKFIAYWLTDYDVKSKTYYARHVLGISKLVNGAAVKFFTVVEPHGAVTVTSSENISYAGE